MKSKDIEWNGKKLKFSYWYSFQIIYNELVCDITWNNRNLCEFFLSKIVAKIQLGIFLIIVINVPYFHKFLKFFFFHLQIVVFRGAYFGFYYNWTKDIILNYKFNSIKWSCVDSCIYLYQKFQKIRPTYYQFPYERIPSIPNLAIIVQ